MYKLESILTIVVLVSLTVSANQQTNTSERSLKIANIVKLTPQKVENYTKIDGANISSVNRPSIVDDIGTGTQMIEIAPLNEKDRRARNEDDKDKQHHHGGGGHKKKKKKKKHKGFHGLFKKLKKAMPKFLQKMHGPSMFMMGVAQANFNNFVMHALMMSKFALTSVIMMIIREMVFGDKDQPVKYYNFGYDDHASHRRKIITSHTYDYKRRKKRHT